MQKAGVCNLGAGVEVLPLLWCPPLSMEPATTTTTLTDYLLAPSTATRGREQLVVALRDTQRQLEAVVQTRQRLTFILIWEYGQAHATVC